jgi:hypothetical protein
VEVAAKEGELTRSRLPLIFWFAAAFLSFAASVASWFLVDRQTGLFIGLWVPSILSLAVLLSLPRVKP